MVITEVKTEGIQKTFFELESIMKSIGFDRWTWDYKKVVYDKKYTTLENTYYLRLQGNVINEKFLEDPNACLELQHPVFVEHFFPHGLDDAAGIPETLLDDVRKTLEEIEKKIT